MKRGKVGTSGREIMASLYGSKGRPETEEYADRCAAQQRARRNATTASLRVIEETKGPKLAESPRTAAKWAAARARATKS